MLPTAEDEISAPPSPALAAPDQAGQLYKTHSATTTLTPRPSQDSELATTKTATTSITSLPMEDSKAPKTEEVVITVHDTPSEISMPQEPARCVKPGRKSMIGGFGGRKSMQLEYTSMWPARRVIQKQYRDKKRMWMWIKIAIAILIIGGAAAIGVGISHAVNGRSR